MIAFFVSGVPVPKQSFRYSKWGNYQPERLTAWQDAIKFYALAYLPPRKRSFFVSLVFHLPDKRRRDSDNLSKAVLDACNDIIWDDDSQVVKLMIEKIIDPGNPGVEVKAEEI